MCHVSVIRPKVTFINIKRKQEEVTSKERKRESEREREKDEDEEKESREMREGKDMVLKN